MTGSTPGYPCGTAFRRCVAAIGLCLFAGMAHAGGYAQYLDEGRALADQLIDNLIEVGVCRSRNECRKSEGHVFSVSKKNGVETIFDIQDRNLASRLLQTSAGTFLIRPLGNELVVKIYSATHKVYRENLLINAPTPFATMKLEKTNADH